MAGYTLPSVKTRALRVTVGCYERGGWHVSIIRDVYDRGVLQDSELVIGPIYCTKEQVQGVVDVQLQTLMAWEESRAARAAADGPGQDMAAARAS
jgi:hypothetical protein